MRRLSTASTCATLLLALIGHAPLPTLAAPTDFKQPNAYAVVIGISQYREEVIPKVPYAVNDAQAIASVLETQGGIPKTHIKLLTDAKATVGDFRNYFGEWLRMRVKPESTVYVYYAGHGTPNPKTGEAYLVPWEGHPDFPSGLYPLKELYETLNKLPAKEVVVLLDSCFSGAAGRSVLAKGARPMVISVENPLLASGKVVVLAAATGNQISSDYDKAGHGLFTYALLTGLQGEADADHDGIVTLKEVFPYVRERVAHTAVDELNREQTPVLLPGEEMLGKRIAQPLAQVSDKPKSEEPKPVQEARARPYEAPRQAGKEITGKDGAPMMLVPAGEFLYGSSKVRFSLPAFYMDKYEVTTSRYRKFLQETGHKEPAFWDEVSQASDGERPVIGVDLNDADAYCHHYGKRLPTDEEWVKAAVGTDGRNYPWGNEAPLSRHANFGKPAWQGYGVLARVGSYEADKSPYGIYDLAGNVREWTSSEGGIGFGSGERVIHGGSWSSEETLLSSSWRNGRVPTYKSDYLGFRCAQDAPK